MLVYLTMPPRAASNGPAGAPGADYSDPSTAIMLRMAW